MDGTIKNPISRRKSQREHKTRKRQGLPNTHRPNKARGENKR